MAKTSSTKPKIALNGLGRIGRVFLRIAHNNPNFEIVALHSRSGLEMYAHLLKYDSNYGVWDKTVEVKGDNLMIDGKAIPFVTDEGQLPWKKLGVDVVVDATGKYTKRDMAAEHLQAGARYVVTTAPMDDPDETFVFKANHEGFDPQKHQIISAASCTTVCSTLTLKVLEESFGVERAFINTVHAFTSDQSLQDSSHRDWRRARSATQSIIPTSSGVSKTIMKIYPHLTGKISALSLRVPVPDPSVVVLTAILKRDATKEGLNQAFKQAATSGLKGHLGVTDLPLVSVDFKGNSNGSTIDLSANEVVDGRLANIIAWYDNEWGYVSQMTKLLEYICQKI
ncbi:MAG: aldehyde dehydrogenase [Patescibacteria group bacterium]|nr:aldehyde dehydrogenase [Patescibacteria group bacterium]